MDKEQLLQQHKSLREEIARADVINYQVTGVIIAATALIFGEGLQQSDPVIRAVIPLIVFVVTIPGYSILTGNRHRTWRIATYMRVFIEPVLRDVGWEIRLPQHSFIRGDFVNYRSSRININEQLVIFGLEFVASVLSGILLISIKDGTELLGGFLHASNEMKFASLVALIFVMLIRWMWTNSIKNKLSRNGTIYRDNLIAWYFVRLEEEKRLKQWGYSNDEINEYKRVTEILKDETKIEVGKWISESPENEQEYSRRTAEVNNKA